MALDPGARVADVPAALIDAALARADWVLASADEARALAGPGEAAAVAGSLARRTGRGVVVHDAERGCVVARGGEVTAVAGYPVAPIDTNGAGDAHNGVFLAGLAAGLDPAAAAARANGAAAIAVSRLGPAGAPRADELAEWFARFTGDQ